MRRQERGSILVHVLITSVLMSIVAAGLISVMLLQYHATQRAEASAKSKDVDQAALNAAMSSWNATGANQVCSSFTMYNNAGNVVSYTCVGTAGTCSCTCSPTPASYPVITVTAAPAGAVGGSPVSFSCTVKVASPNL